MATFRNRHGKWQARVQRKGQQSVSKSFQSKEDAQRSEQVKLLNANFMVAIALAQKPKQAKTVFEPHIGNMVKKHKKPRPSAVQKV